MRKLRVKTADFKLVLNKCSSSSPNITKTFPRCVRLDLGNSIAGNMTTVKTAFLGSLLRIIFSRVIFTTQGRVQRFEKKTSFVKDPGVSKNSIGTLVSVQQSLLDSTTVFVESMTVFRPFTFQPLWTVQRAKKVRCANFR